VKFWNSNTLLLLILVFTASACKKEKIELPKESQAEIVQYLHVSHSRLADNSGIMPEMEAINYSKYDLVMLGGDLAYLTTEFPWVMDYTDSIYDFANPDVLWSVGNHDYTNPSMISGYTNRPLHYTHHKNGITYLVLDSEEDACNISGSQLALFNAVADTISESSHLIVLTHKLIWMYGNEHLEPNINSVSNGDLGTGNWQINPNNFYNDVYWKLLDIQNNGTQVICIAGDMGLFASEFEFRFDSGIQFLASGGHYNFGGKGLIFDHNLESQELTWEFVDLNDL
jgi:hypothetical protein